MSAREPNWVHTAQDDAVGVMREGRGFLVMLRPAVTPYEMRMTRGELLELRDAITAALGVT